MVRLDRRKSTACLVRSQFLTCGRYGARGASFVVPSDAASASLVTPRNASLVASTARGCLASSPGASPNPPELRSTALRPSLDRYPRKCRISFTFFSSPAGHGVDARKHAGGGATRLSLASAPSRRLARSRYSSRSPGAPSWHARCAVVVSGDAAWLSFAPPSTSSHAVSSADCVIFVASLNTTPKVPSDKTYPSPYLLV
mmetsp:Transcript_3067/g.12124  ORF Transcript_3067/g.12124 Transcript_3067/m.12124 type:complete len:200 (-) Transcript_3067:306-905(-)